MRPTGDLRPNLGIHDDKGQLIGRYTYPSSNQLTQEALEVLPLAARAELTRRALNIGFDPASEDHGPTSLAAANDILGNYVASVDMNRLIAERRRKRGNP